MKLKNNPKFVDGFSKLARFMFLLKDFDLSMEETKLLIWKFFNVLTYRECAEMVGRGYSKQNAQEKIKSALLKIKRQSFKQGNLENFKRLLLGFRPTF